MTNIYVLPGDQPNPRFPLGDLYVTAAASQALEPKTIAAGLARHSQGDWGETAAEDRGLNEESLANGSRLLSVYKSESGTRFWIITEADRSATTVLLPEDY